MSAPSNKPVPTTGPISLGIAGTPTVTANQHDGIVFPSAVYAVATNSPDIINADCKGIRIFTTNAATGGATVVVKVQVKDPATGAYTDLAGAATAALGAVTSSLMTIYPGLTGIADSAGITINQHLGPIFRLVLTPSATTTAGVGVDFLV